MVGKIIIVEDDFVLVKEISRMLSEYYTVQAYSGVKIFDDSFIWDEVALYILDVMLPDGNGLELCKAIRQHCQTPILLLTVLDDERSIVAGLESGADDYVTKPFSGKVLMARIKALIRRNAGSKSSRVYCGDLVIDFLNCAVYKKNENIHIHAKEFQIIATLIEAKGSLVSRNRLLEQIWDIEGCFIDDNTLSVHMSRIRKKLGNDRGTSYIVTERGFGYRWGVKIEG